MDLTLSYRYLARKSHVVSNSSNIIMYTLFMQVAQSIFQKKVKKIHILQISNLSCIRKEHSISTYISVHKVLDTLLIFVKLQWAKLKLAEWYSVDHCQVGLPSELLLLFASYWSLLNLECPSWLFLLKCQHFKSLLIQKHLFTVVNNN